jgi:hypothetical protein
MLRSTSVVITTTGRVAVDRVVAGEQADLGRRRSARPGRAYFWLDSALIGVV